MAPQFLPQARWSSESLRTQVAKSELLGILRYLEYGLSDLALSPSRKEFEEWAILIFEAMTTRNRLYHSPQHLFDLLDGASPLQCLAILFHDIVYIQVDRARHAKIRQLMLPLSFEGLSFSEKTLSMKLPGLNVFERDPVGSLIYEIFGVKAGQVLGIHDGLNELLSAKIALKLMGPYLTREQQIRITAMIEATIPFRTLDAVGKSPIEKLRQRLLPLLESAERLQEVLREVVDVANRDISNFAAKQPVSFLENTWRLITEGSSALQSPTYHIRDYRIAVQKAEQFLSTIEPQAVFQRYGEFPHETEYRSLLNRTSRNLKIARDYFRAKLVAVSILEALAVRSGGDAPYELFLGGLGNRRPVGTVLKNWLAKVAERIRFSSRESRYVHGLLLLKNFTHSRFDLKFNPLAAFVYRRLKPAELAALLREARAYTDGQMDSYEFLSRVPFHILKVLGRVVARSAVTRRWGVIRPLVPKTQDVLPPSDQDAAA